MTYKTKASDKVADFGTGATRDSAEGKGRYDLLPFEAIEYTIGFFDSKHVGDTIDVVEPLEPAMYALKHMLEFNYLDIMANGPDHPIYKAIVCTCAAITQDEERRLGLAPEHDYLELYAHIYPFTPFVLRRLAGVYERGAARRGDRNWEQGMPEQRLRDSATRHLSQYLEQELVPELAEEDHLGQALWNMLAIVHFRIQGIGGNFDWEALNCPEPAPVPAPQVPENPDCQDCGQFSCVCDHCEECGQPKCVCEAYWVCSHCLKRECAGDCQENCQENCQDGEALVGKKVRILEGFAKGHVWVVTQYYSSPTPGKEMYTVQPQEGSNISRGVHRHQFEVIQ